MVKKILRYAQDDKKKLLPLPLLIRCQLPTHNCQLQNRHFPIVLIPVADWREAGYFFEHAEGFAVGVADGVHHFVDVFAAGFEAFFGGFDLYALQVFDWGVGCCLFEAAFEVAAADGEHAGELVDREFIADIVFHEELGLADGLVLVLFLSHENGEGRLAFALDLDLEQFGAVHGHFAPAKLFYQVDHQVQKRIRAAAGVHAELVGNDPFGLELYVGEGLAECVGRDPVGRYLFAFEQSG